MRRRFVGGAIGSAHRPFSQELLPLLWFDANGQNLFQQCAGRVLSLELVLPDWKKRKNPPVVRRGIFILLFITLGNSVKIPFLQRLRLRLLGTAVGKG
ncbi:hypothetical protein DWY99_09930 [[Clostridium] leptum]|uniref:Uncharacterized protein n=1 Tax=[Clostridium] leptum TaxID=1535 RepID=A0A412AVY6_9FIRM|nr:hypothetical protein DWY99_09930 [[Clostridium] leptum]